MHVNKILSFGQSLTNICTSLRGHRKISFSEYQPPKEDAESDFSDKKAQAKKMLKISWVFSVTSAIFWFAAKR